jgi:hypothetical protein
MRARNSHCHPCNPSEPSKYLMMDPDTGPAINEPIIAAVIKTAMVLPRRAAGYQ